MKIRKLLHIALLLFTSTAFGQTADFHVAAGRAFLPTNFPAAYTSFNSALALNPNHETANVLAAATRLLLLPTQPAASNFLNRLGVANTGRDLFNWAADFTHDSEGNVVLPPNLNSAEAVAVCSNTLLPALSASLANLARITNVNFTLTLTADETGIATIILDYGDIQLLQAGLHALDFAGHTLNTHNLSVVIGFIAALGEADELSLQRVLVAYPNLLKLGSKSELAASRGALTNAIACYMAASAFIRDTRGPDAERLFMLSTNDFEAEAMARDVMAKAVLSLESPVVFDTNSNYGVYAGSYFSGNTSLRSLLPQFDGDAYVPNSLPDYTFGGLLVDVPAWAVEGFLREMTGQGYAGIYFGQFGGPFLSGNLCVFVRPDLHAMVLGFDPSQGYFFRSDFELYDDGSWYSEQNGAASTGSIHQDGFFEGELQMPPGSWVGSVWGSRASDQGPFRTAAGLYSGTWSFMGESGKILGVLSADGQLFYCVTDRTNGVIGIAATQIGSNNEFSSTLDTTVVAGTLNLAMFRIAGTVTDGVTGTFTMARTAFVPSDAPPVITIPPQDQTKVMGSAVTFRVTAVGAPPLCYQWFSNGVAISQATSAALVLNNVRLSSTAVYSVNVRNLAGETNAAAELNVVPESVRPVISITAPAARQRVSNAVFAVTGTATDNAGISNIWCQLNGGEWTNPTGVAPWSATVNLTPGTNIVRAFALDISGNTSVTQAVSFVYVVSAPLLVQTNGPGSFLPNCSGQWMEVGKVYRVTARPNAGCVFSNWMSGAGVVLTNGATLAFTMQSNLMLVANFITNPFPAVVGNYAGLFYSTNGNGVTTSNAGYLSVRVTPNGSFTARLLQGPKAYALAGRFALDGTWSAPTIRGATDWGIGLQLDLAGGDEITGEIQHPQWTAQVVANRAVFSRTHQTPDAGKYTMIIPGSDDPAHLPGGHGVAAVNVNPAGALGLLGTLGDGTRVSQSTFISKHGQWPLYAPLYAKKGLLLGWMTITNTGTADLEGLVSWIKPEQPGTRIYPAGFDWPYDTGTNNAFGSAFTNRVPLMSWTNGIAILEDGNLGQSITNGFTVGALNRVTGTNRFRLTFVTAGASAGLFNGSVLNPATGKLVPFSGALFQKQDAGAGWFLGTNQTGRVSIEPVNK